MQIAGIKELARPEIYGNKRVDHRGFHDMQNKETERPTKKSLTGSDNKKEKMSFGMYGIVEA